MRRNARQQHHNLEDVDPDEVEDIFARPAYDDDEFEDLLQLARRPNGHARLGRFENTLEVKVQEGDTLQALALRFHSSVADIKRLNKIDRENEIHAHRVIRIPVTVHNVLLGNGGLEALPAIHRSGNNSPRHNLDREPAPERNPLEDARQMLDERLLVAAVNASGALDPDQPSTSRAANQFYEGAQGAPNDEANMEQPFEENAALLNHMLVDRHAPLVRPIPGPSLSAIDWSGSDCDLSWICLLIFILALCVVIPLVYVIYLAEHPHHNHSAQ
ncbi:lysM and putative peptidoglycan-binding domain-containing protein 3 [Drosophila biarmipes]|uniref:lysM and putative peptidoglycan-binding domain-containing protein 3 n=1 Tax=Drosophila biarmipes TaxID=125945 RepID=UPI0007E5C608|nr:lysM and putative peptidoglycan-binding domain-containing protein 3 [Drosophila biarmipes]